MTSTKDEAPHSDIYNPLLIKGHDRTYFSNAFANDQNNPKNICISNIASFFNLASLKHIFADKRIYLFTRTNTGLTESKMRNNIQSQKERLYQRFLRFSTSSISVIL